MTVHAKDCAFWRNTDDDGNEVLGLPCTCGADKPSATCTGCTNRRPEGNHEWACLECKRWWPDKFRRDDCAARVGCTQYPTCAGCAYADDAAREGRRLPLLGVGR